MDQKRKIISKNNVIYLYDEIIKVHYRKIDKYSVNL